MWHGINILLIAKYAVAIFVLVCIFLTPAYLATANDRDKLETSKIRFASWLFGWSFVGWLFALFLASKK